MNRLAAALAYQPTTARCHRCNKRFLFAEMDHVNRYCHACWAAECRKYQRSRSGLLDLWKDKPIPPAPSRAEIDDRINRLSDRYGFVLSQTQLTRFYELYRRSADAALIYLERTGAMIDHELAQHGKDICKCGEAKSMTRQICYQCVREEKRKTT